MKRTALLFNVFLILGLLLVTNTKAVMAGPNLSLNPATGDYKVGDDFAVTVKIESGGESVGGVDGVGTYDASKLELISVKKASSFVYSPIDDTDSGGGCRINMEYNKLGKFDFSCYTEDNSLPETKTKSGDLVVFNFKAKAVGTALVKFNCVQDSTTDSNIVKMVPVSEVMVCSENVDGSYVITAGTGSNSTSTPTPNNSAQKTVDGTEELPKTGGFGATLGLVLFGIVSVVSAVFLKFL